MTAAQWLAVLAIPEAHLPHTHPLIATAQWRQARTDQPPPPTEDQGTEPPTWE